MSFNYGTNNASEKRIRSVSPPVFENAAFVRENIQLPMRNERTKGKSFSASQQNIVTTFPQTPQRSVVFKFPVVFGRYPQPMQCFYCENNIVTRTEIVATVYTHFLAALCCLFASCIYCTNSCKGVDHYCPKCNALLGKHTNV